MDHTVLPATRHKQTHPALTPAGEGWYSIYRPRRDGRLSWSRCPITRGRGIEPETAGSEVWRPNHCATKTLPLAINRTSSLDSITITWIFVHVLTREWSYICEQYNPNFWQLAGSATSCSIATRYHFKQALWGHLLTRSHGNKNMSVRVHPYSVGFKLFPSQCWTVRNVLDTQL